MEYKKIVKAEFIERENRFVATVMLPDGMKEKVHVKNTGRCRELLVPLCTVYLEDFSGRMGNRKMRYSLVAVEKVIDANADGSGRNIVLINMDSQAPNKVIQEALQDGSLLLPETGNIIKVIPEQKYGDSRFDFFVEGSEKNAYIEVKGVTLEDQGFARFPDAPTERGIKHINGLIDAVSKGFEAYIIFVIQMKGIHTFGPNYATHPEFGETLRRADDAGVHIYAVDCKVTETGLFLDSMVNWNLSEE